MTKNDGIAANSLNKNCINKLIKRKTQNNNDVFSEVCMILALIFIGIFFIFICDIVTNNTLRYFLPAVLSSYVIIFFISLGYWSCKKWQK